MMAELLDIQSGYKNGTAPFKYIHDCLFYLDGAAIAITRLKEQSTNA